MVIGLDWLIKTLIVCGAYIAFELIVMGVFKFIVKKPYEAAKITPGYVLIKLVYAMVTPMARGTGRLMIEQGYTTNYLLGHWIITFLFGCIGRYLIPYGFVVLVILAAVWRQKGDSRQFWKVQVIGMLLFIVYHILYMLTLVFDSVLFF